MLPDFLSNSYVQYKEDTNNFITWLVDTAKKYGYVRPPSIPTSTDAVPRLKGRARTDAKKAASISTSTDATPPLKGKANTDEKKAASMPKRKKMEVSVQDIVSLAKTIVANTSRKNPVVVPQYVLKWARSAVDARRQFVTWFQTQAFNQPALQDDNERYTYFVQVLEDALDILAPHVTASPKENALPTRSDPSKQVEAPGQTLRNMFENLEMDEPQEIDLLDAAVVDVHDVVAVEDSIETQLKELCELESSEAEMRFAIFCTLQDAHRVKDFIIKTWKNYISGEIDLVTASVTTNTAISFVHGAEEQLMASYPQFAGYPELLRAFYPLAMQTVARMADASDRSAEEINARTTQFELRHVQDVSMATDHGSTHMDVASDPQHDFDEVEFLFARPCRLLEVFCDWFWFSPSGFRTRRAAAADGVVPPADLSKMSPEQKEDDWYILADVLPEIMLLTDLVIPAEDEFSQGMRQVLLGDSIPLWVVFAHQVYLEIHRTLREQVGRGLVELRVAKTQVKASLKDYFENEKSMLDDHQPEAGAQILHELDEILNKWVEEDAFTKGKEREYIGCLDRPYLLLSQHVSYYLF